MVKYLQKCHHARTVLDSCPESEGEGECVTHAQPVNSPRRRDSLVDALCGYDVVVACDLAKVRARVRFSVPAPLSCSLTWSLVLCEGEDTPGPSAGIAQLVERHLAKVNVGSSSLLSRSKHTRVWSIGRAPGFQPGRRKSHESSILFTRSNHFKSLGVA